MLKFGLHWSVRLRVDPAIELTDEQESELTVQARSKTASVRLAQRAHIVLLSAQGMQNKDIVEAVGVGRVQVGRWRDCYARLQGMERDLPCGAPPSNVDVTRLVELSTQTKPDVATHWSTREMAAELDVSSSTVMWHWQANGLNPHIAREFKVSPDPKFVEKLESWPAYVPARARPGAVLRREEPGAGAGPNAAGPAADEGASPRR